MIPPESSGTGGERVAALPQRWSGPVRGSHRMGYTGPGTPLYGLRGPRETIRERYQAALVTAKDLTANAIRVAIAYARHGNRDGSHIFPSEALIATETSLSSGTVSRCVTELEDAVLRAICGRRKRRRGPSPAARARQARADRAAALTAHLDEVRAADEAALAAELPAIAQRISALLPRPGGPLGFLRSHRAAHGGGTA